MRTYSNPVARDGDFADPFILRFNGRYYLYCTNADLRCWSSTDLIEWSLEGPTIAPGTFDGLIPFAPEVTYENGVFYLYTSPLGTGHRVLQAEYPTGPFEPITGNVGHSIDGHVFIDDDGRRYFYWAGDEGIWGCEMTSHTEFGTPVLTGASMHGWTEGPFVVKRGGRYHMTLTGNHYLSPGYRIDAAVSDSPLTGFTESPLNPLLVSTAPAHLGLGHSSTVLGPDLVSHYLIYHNLNPDESRDLNIDRIRWNGEHMLVDGPSQRASAPARPDVATAWGSREADRWQILAGNLSEVADVARLMGPGTIVWSPRIASQEFTSEHTLGLIAASHASYGLVAVDGSREHWRIEFRPTTNTVAVVRDSETLPGEAAALPDGFRHDVLHCCRITVAAGLATVYVDGRRQLEFSSSAPSLRLGYVVDGGELAVGYTAATECVEATASVAVPRTVPGRFLARSELPHEASSGPARDLALRPGEVASFPLYASVSGVMGIQLTGDFPSGAAVELLLDGVGNGIRLSGGSHALTGRLHIPEGEHVLRLTACDEPLMLRLISVEPVSETAIMRVGFDLSGTDKAAAETALASDGIIEATLRAELHQPGSHADLLFAASQLADGGEGDDPVLGTNFFLGYSLQLHRDRIVLARHAYDERVLVECAHELDISSPLQIRLDRTGSVITAQVGGLDPLSCDDPWPLGAGAIGVRTWQSSLTAEASFVSMPLSESRAQDYEE